MPRRRKFGGFHNVVMLWYTEQRRVGSARQKRLAKGTTRQTVVTVCGSWTRRDGIALPSPRVGAETGAGRDQKLEKPGCITCTYCTEYVPSWIYLPMYVVLKELHDCSTWCTEYLCTLLYKCSVPVPAPPKWFSSSMHVCSLACTCICMGGYVCMYVAQLALVTKIDWEVLGYHNQTRYHHTYSHILPGLA